MKETMNQIQNEQNVSTDAEKHRQHLKKIHNSSHRMGIITIFLLFGIFGFWSVFAKLETTITANGKVISQSYNKIVMHPNGGIVKNIFVREGDYANKDQSLLELDNTTYQTQLASNIKKFDRNLFTICRLKAEAAFKQQLDCSEYKEKIIDKENLQKLSFDTHILFSSDIKSLQAKENLLQSQNEILYSENRGLEKQITSNQKLLASLERELKKWNKLLKEDAIDELKVVETQRQIIQSNLQINSLQSNIEKNLATITAHKKQMELERESFKNNALSRTNEFELENQLIDNMIISLKNTIQNSVIKSPSDGFITDMKIHAAGEVVTPQKPIMSIVPSENNLMIEAYILPTDIEKVYKGQKVEVSFPAFVDPSAIPIEGELTYISADTIIRDGSEGSFYKALIKITPKGFDAIKKNNFKIILGMPSAVFILTGKKTLSEYLLHPITQMFKGIYHAN